MEARNPAIRFRIAFLIAAAIAISYLDRQTLPVALRAVGSEIPISNVQFSQLQAAFLLAYAAAYAGGGRLIDSVGVRRGFLLMMAWWSLACAGQALATGFWTLAAARFLLGIGEGGGFPAATKAVAEWFPARERSMAMGIIHAGSSLGSVLAPPAVAGLVVWAGWRSGFVALGLLGTAWTVWWWRGYPGPPEGPDRGSHQGIRAKQSERETSVPWAALFAFPQVWGLFFAKFLYDSAFYFYLFWLPKYLFDARGFDTKSVGYYAWIPYAAHGLGGLAGGWFSGRLIGWGYSLNFARKLVLGVSAALMPVVFFVTRSPVETAIVLLSIAYFGQAATSTLVMVLPADLFPPRAVGSVAGLIGFGGALGGIVFGFVVGYLLDNGFGYGTVFGLVSTFHLVAYCVILLTVRTVAPVKWAPKRAAATAC